VTDVDLQETVKPSQAWGGLLRQRDFRLLWSGETISKLGTSMGSFALPLVATGMLGVSTFTMGLLTAFVWLPWLVIGLPAGAWVDRLRKRPLMIACNILSLVLVASVPTAAWLGVLTTAQLLAVALLTGVASVFFSTAYGAYLPLLVAKKDLLEASTKLRGSETAMGLVGPSAGGLAAQLFGTVTGMLGQVVGFAASTLCLRSIRVPEPRPVAKERTSLRRDVVEGMRFVGGDPLLRSLMIFGGVSNIALNGGQAVQIIFLTRDVGLDAGTVGVLYTVSSLGGLVGVLVASSIAKRFGTARGALLCQVCSAPFYLLTPLTGTGYRMILFVVAGVVVGTGIVAANIICNSFRLAYCPPELRGRVSATMSTINYGGTPLGAVLGGTIGTVIGAQPTILVMAAAHVLSCSFLIASPIRKLRDFPTALPTKPAAQSA
jgi:MFS family permease